MKRRPLQRSAASNGNVSSSSRSSLPSSFPTVPLCRHSAAVACPPPPPPPPPQPRALCLARQAAIPTRRAVKAVAIGTPEAREAATSEPPEAPPSRDDDVITPFLPQPHGVSKSLKHAAA